MDEQQNRHEDIARRTLTVFVILGLLVLSTWILTPFLPAILWGITLVLATWPAMRWFQERLGGRRSLAVVIMTLILLLVLIVPLWLAFSTVIANLDVIGGMARRVLSMHVPPAPDWLAPLPIIGPSAAQAWATLASADISDVASKALTPYAGTVTRWLATATGSVGSMFVQFLLTTAVAATLYAGGEQAATYVLRFGRRLGGERGERAIHLAGAAIKAVALGVVVTAVVQSLIGGIGVAIVGLPLAGLLTALMFVLCLVQLGPGIVLFPAVIWLYYSGHALGGTVLLVITLVAVTIDQFVRPILIRRGADLPLLLIIVGVIGGLISFGFLGIFIGPTVLAVTYTLLNAWMSEAETKPAP